jgi:hypothetical protein
MAGSYNIGELVWKVTGDPSGINQALDKSEKKVTKTGEFFRKAAIMIGGFFAISKIKQWGEASIKNASDAQETWQKFGNVFPKIIDLANSTAVALAQTANTSVTGAKEMLASTGNILQSMGFQDKAALEMAAALAQRGADIVSFTNYQGGAVEATRIMTKAVLGQREALEALDIKITDDQLKSLAASNGLVYEKMTQQQKAQLTMNEIFRQSEKAMGDVAKSSNSYAYVTRALDNKMRDLSERVGSEMLPAMTELKKAFIDGASEGGAISTIMIKLGWVIGKIVDGITLVVRGLNLIAKQGQNDQKVFAILKQEADKFGVSYWYIAQVMAAASGNMSKALKIVRMDMANGDVEAVKFGNAFARIKSEVGNTKEEMDELLKAQGRLNGSLKETPQNTYTKPVADTSKLKENVSGVADKTKEAQENADKLNKSFSKLGSLEKFNVINDYTTAIVNGFSTLINSAAQYTQTLYNSQLENLDRAEQRALEAAGVAEETALQKAERELAIAQDKGKKEEIAEKERAVKKAKIEEAYEKKRIKLQYEAQLAGWEFQYAGAITQSILAPLNALASGFQAPWFMLPWFPIGMASLAEAAALYNVAAVAKSKPKKPKFAEGGIVPGNMTSGDNVPINVNAREMVINQEQQGNLWDFIKNGSQNANNITVHNPVYIGGELIYDNISRAIEARKITLDSRAIVNR